MNKFIETMIEKYKEYPSDGLQNYWTNYGGMSEEFKEDAIEKLHALNVGNLLDIGSGGGEFVKFCIDNEIDAHGIDPNAPDGHELITRISFQQLTSIFMEKEIDFKWDCISFINTIHSDGQVSRSEMVDLFEFFKKYAKYILISIPIKNKDILDDNIFKLVTSTIKYRYAQVVDGILEDELKHYIYEIKEN